METLLKHHRQALTPKRSLVTVANAISVNRSTLYRIEAGTVAPTRETARRLFEYYAGAVPLAHIYDPEFALREDSLPSPAVREFLAVHSK